MAVNSIEKKPLIFNSNEDALDKPKINLKVLAFEAIATGLFMLTTLTAGPNDLQFGIGFCVTVFLFGDLSGAHMNPAITLGLMYRKFESFPKVLGLIYMVTQLIGAGMVIPIYWYQRDSIPNTPFAPTGVEYFKYFTSEVTGTFIFVYSIQVHTFSKTNITKDKLLGSFVCTLGILFGRHLSSFSGSMINPAFGLVTNLAFGLINKNSQFFINMWFHILGPFCGSCLAILFFKATMTKFDHVGIQSTESNEEIKPSREKQENIEYEETKRDNPDELQNSWQQIYLLGSQKQDHNIQ